MTGYSQEPATNCRKLSSVICHLPSHRRLQLLGRFQHFLDGALHVEGLLGDVVVLARDDLLEAAHGVGNLHISPWDAGELLGNVEGLRKELLHLAGAGHGELVFFRELVDAQNGDDVLQILVALQDALHALGHVVVVLAYDARGKYARGRGQRIYGRIDAEFGERAAQHGGRVEVSKGGGRSGVGQVVGGHVDGLHAGDRALAGGGDALLQLAHFGGQVGLVAHVRGHAAQERGNLRAGLREAEDVVDEQKRVGAFDVAEVLGDGERAEGHAQAGSGRLGHLPVYQLRLRFGPVARLDDAGLGHLQPQVVALAGALAHAAKDGVAAVVLGHVVDEFHDDHRLAHAGAAEQADLAALEEGLDQVDDLDAGLEHLLVGGLLGEERRGPVNRHARLFADGAQIVDRVADDVDDAAQRLFAHRHTDGSAQVDGLHPANHAVGGFHGHGADATLAQVLLDFKNDADGRGYGEALAHDAQRLVDGRHRRFFKLHVHRGTGDLDYLADILCHFFCLPKCYAAAAPLTISMISLVMAAWRTRFMCSVSASIISEALLVAESIAVMRAACSAATDSVMA